MTTVVEIGCGNSAGPFFDGFDQHYAVDIHEAKLLRAVSNEPGLTPLLADAANLYSFEDSSVAVVLARNVFGDAFLGHVHQAMKLQLRNEELPQATKDAIDKLKLGITNEASRILLSGGKLIVVEQYTPEDAEPFIDRVNSGKLERPHGLSVFRRVGLAEVTPPNYSAVHLNYKFGFSRIGAQTWVAEQS